MKDIDLEKRRSNVSVLSFGQTRSGKTHWAATWPKPYFMCDASERGWTTISHMDPKNFYEPDVPPIVKAIEDPSDINLCYNDLVRLVAEDKVRTLVVDSLTFLAQLFLDTTGKNTSNNMQLYQALGGWLRSTRIRLQKLPINVIWLCLETTDGPLIPGKQAGHFPASCDFVFRHTIYTEEGKRLYLIRTAAHDGFALGSRSSLPDPLGRIIKDAEGNPALQVDSTYRGLVEHLNAKESVGNIV